MTDHHSTVDRISNLPSNILEKILGNLSIQAAGRTSILSTKWRYKWVDIPNLLFHEESGERLDLSSDRLVNLVYEVLLTHRGQIDKFMLSADRVHDIHFKDWIVFLRKKGIKNLTFDFDPSGPLYNLCSCLFSCQQLNHLCVTNCIVQIPQTFKGFSSLVCLQFVRFSIRGEVLESLIRSCPILEKLVLLDFHHLDPLNIDAPKLKYLHVEGGFGGIYVENSPLLVVVSFRMTSDELAFDGDNSHALDLKSVWPLCSLSQVKNLTFAGLFLKFLASRYIPGGVPHAFNHLKVLDLSEVYFYELDTITLVLSILKCSSSSLQKLSISASGPFSNDVYGYIRKQNEANICFKQLRVVKIHLGSWFWGSRPQRFGTELSHWTAGPSIYGNMDENKLDKPWRSDLELIKLILACSPKLENMLVIVEDEEYDGVWFKRKLLSPERASPLLLFRYLSTFQ